MASGKTWNRRLAIAGGAALLLLGAIPARAQSVLNRGGGAEPESSIPLPAARRFSIYGDLMVGLLASRRLYPKRPRLQPQPLALGEVSARR